MIGFNKPYLTGNELIFIQEAATKKQLAGDGIYTAKCSEWLENEISCYKALLTHSCTAALEMAAILADIQEGDEVIMPSFTFVSTANAFVLRGATPVFVDVRKDTLNINEQLIEDAITKHTKAIVPVHYAGVPCEMDTIMEIARRHNLLVIEDAAQGILSSYKGRPLGSIGDIGCLSFHETKNIISGEGGALLLNNDLFSRRAQIIREKGTNRAEFMSGEVSKYSWVDIGSSFLPGEMTAAFLWAQLQEGKYITKKRKKIWNFYHQAFQDLENVQQIKRPSIPEASVHNGHIYYLLLNTNDLRDNFIEAMSSQGVQCVFHYVPLHSSKIGKKIGRISGDMSITEDIASRLVRLPLWLGVDAKRVIECVNISILES
jgi:dTDP-4-amino-4,6-dideoxygalactose transaminase